nr:reverse transcriptase domain-containing protein [Tanacetum cinerariifolium]
LEGQAYEVVKAFYPDVVYLHFKMEECHKMFTDQIDWANPEGDQVKIDISKPLPLSGPPGSGQALSISKMKATHYLDFGFELLVPEHLWINEVCTMTSMPLTVYLIGGLIIKNSTLTNTLLTQAVRVEEYKVNRLNPGMNTRFWTDKDVERSKEFIHAIERRLKTRRIVQNLECFVGGRKIRVTPKYHNKDGNPARANIKQALGLQAFIARFKTESLHIKGMPPVLRISTFKHGHGHPELAKKLNDKITKIADEISQERVWGRSGPREFQRSMGTCAPYSRRDTFTPLTKIPKEILAMEGVNFPLPPPLIGTPEKQNLNKFCDYHGDRGHNTNDCFHLKKQIEKAVTLGKLAHLLKDICRGNPRNGSHVRGGMKVINMVSSERNRKRPYEMGSPRLTKEIAFPVILRSSLIDASIILEGEIEGY